MEDGERDRWTAWTIGPITITPTTHKPRRTHLHVHIVLLVKGDAALKVVVRHVVGGGLPKLRHVVRDHPRVLADGLDPQRLVPVLWWRKRRDGLEE